MVRSRTDTRSSPDGNGRVDRAGRQGSHVVEMQRRRLVTATTELVYERGVQGLTAALVADRAGMSRRTFHDIFEDREGCLLAAFEEAVEQATRAVLPAAEDQEKWADRVRAGLTGLLSFLDYEPGMARLLVVEALAAGAKTLEARRRVLEQVIAIIDQGRVQSKTGREPSPLTAEGTVGAVFSVIHARMLDDEHRPLIELAAPLMAMIAQPYLGAAAAQKELQRPVVTPEPVVPRLPSDPFKDLPIRLTYRTALVLSSIAAHPGASSKQIARAAGITDEGQTSKLLNRLQRYELIHDTGVGPAKGMPRAWQLTQRGEGVLQAVGEGN
ncbi:MAG TPA: TetR family transcriptional regulator [Solirubrobacteraceae bacterium]|nr:TetR family transcriptional regulator [Solirubrobacteraceae bacterium]